MKYHAFNTIKFPLSHQCPDQHTAAIDCTTRFDKKIGGILFQTAIERGANGSLQFTETTGLQSAKGGFAVIIWCQYAEFRCKTIHIYFALLYILTTHQLNIYHSIFCIIGCIF